MANLVSKETLQELANLIATDIKSKSDSLHTHEILDIDGLTEAIGNINSFDVIVSDSLPETSLALTHTIYMIPKTNSETNNIYDEYMLLNGNFEKIGDTQIDLSQYATKTELSNLLEGKSDTNHTHDEFNPMVLELENNNNNFSVGVDSVGTKYDIIESSESTIELNGRTLVNLMGKNNLELTATSGETIAFMYYDEKKFKPSTLYTVLITTSSAKFKNYSYFINLSDSTTINFNNPTLVTSNSDLGTNGIHPHFYAIDGGTITEADLNDINIICLEGDYTNVPLSYFEGLKSSAETNGNKLKVKSVGKNLFNVDLMKVNQNDAITDVYENGFRMEYIASNKRIGTYIYDHNLKKGKTYTLSLNLGDYSLTSNTIYFCIDYVDGTSLYTSKSVYSEKMTLTVTKDVEKIFFYMHYSSDSVGDYVNLYNIQIEEGENTTEYETYKESIKTIQLPEPLRSLPNGVHDEIFVHDDKVVVTRNVGQVVLDGSESWSYNSSSGYFGLSPSSSGITNYQQLKTRTNVLSDNISTELTNGSNITIQTGDSSYAILIYNPNYTVVDDFKTWLQSNITNFAYPLETPTYEWFEIPSPRLYKDGHVFIESGAVPLTTTKHEVNTSIRSAIDTNTDEIWGIKENTRLLAKDLQDKLDNKANLEHTHDEYSANNLYVIKDSLEGYVLGYNSSGLGAMDNTRKEHTYQYINVSEGDIITIQQWVTLPSSETTWVACQTETSSGTFIRRVVTKDYTTLPNGTSYTILQVTIASGEDKIRVSARMYEDGKVMITKGNNTPSYALSINDRVASITNSSLENKVSSTNVSNIVVLTQAEYDALATKDANTLYIING